MRTYNVILKKDVDYQSFWNDMENENDGGKLYIPNRRVDSPNKRLASPRQTWYTLTDEEAEIVRNDERVLAVEIPPEYRDDIIMMPKVIQSGDFTKTSSDVGEYINWGLIRSNSQSNNYGSGTTTSENFIYTIDGTGVDIVIQDSGIEPYHPEWSGSFGQHRLDMHDWFSVSQVSGSTQSENHYRDYHGHGTHCAGIAAGKTYGWAKGAKIYSQKLRGLEGSGDSGTGITTTYAFDTIKEWHNNKESDLRTGFKRPTVVNMSWGYFAGFDTVSSLTYRGVSYTDTNTTSNATYREENYGLVNNNGALFGVNFICNLRVSSVDVDVEEMIDAGIIVTIAAGNRGNKVDVEAGTDYNNFVVTDSGTQYYHRGSSPYSDRALIVGNVDSSVHSSVLDRKAISSECGPGVDIYAPGTNIMSACSNTNQIGGQSYYWDSNYKQANISGTSMAAPQVAGIAALILQTSPNATPQQVKETLLNIASSSLYSTGLDNDWTDDRSIKGGNTKIVYNKYNVDGGGEFKGFSNTNTIIASTKGNSKVSIKN